MARSHLPFSLSEWRSSHIPVLSGPTCTSLQGQERGTKDICLLYFPKKVSNTEKLSARHSHMQLLPGRLFFPKGTLTVCTAHSGRGNSVFLLRTGTPDNCLGPGPMPGPGFERVCFAFLWEGLHSGEKKKICVSEGARELGVSLCMY